MDDRPLIAVAHEDTTHRDAASRVLRDAGYRVVAVSDGESALDLLDAAVVAALVADVALTTPPFYRICEIIKERGHSTRVLLVSSIYSKTAYKRRATNLYGADDYVEQHHIADSLAPKIKAMLNARAGEFERIATNETTDRKIRTAAESRLVFKADPASRAGAEDARRLAKIIVSDMALYIAPDIERWRDGGCDVDDLPERLQAGLEEARRLFAESVPSEADFDADYVLEALMAIGETKS
jgi:DNA-binding response OmpR family regulator